MILGNVCVPMEYLNSLIIFKFYANIAINSDIYKWLEMRDVKAPATLQIIRNAAGNYAVGGLRLK